MLGGGLEPPRYCYQGILSQAHHNTLQRCEESNNMTIKSLALSSLTLQQPATSLVFASQCAKNVPEITFQCYAISANLPILIGIYENFF